MLDSRIIIVDGMPGTGKSTVSQFIHLQLHAMGRPSHWCHEELATHPVRLFYDPERHLSWSDYNEEAASCWQRYAHELHTQNQTAILDAAIFQNHLRSMLIFNCDRNAILDLVCRIERLIASLNPVLIYLRPKDIEKNFRDVVEVRGQRMLELWIEAHDQYPYTHRLQVSGYSGFIAFWNEFGDISDRIFEGLAITNLRQDISNEDWGARYREILEFLELPLPFEPSSSSVLDRFTGNYVPLDTNAGAGFVLQARDGCLVVAVDQPTFDVARGPIGRFHEVCLIPNGKNRFYVAAWPHEVQFTEDELGTVVTMLVSISEDGWPQFSEVYMKQQ
ncbi:MAG: hypothetical protein P1V19_16465 [Gimesia sp.]|nr:hypothetical protein [Gimesia sp.]